MLNEKEAKKVLEGVLEDLQENYDHEIDDAVLTCLTESKKKFGEAFIRPYRIRYFEIIKQKGGYNGNKKNVKN